MQPSITKGLRAFFQLGDGASGGYRFFQQAHGVEDGRDHDFVADGRVDHHVVETAGGPVGPEVVFYKFNAVAIHGVDQFFGFFFVVPDPAQAPQLFRPGGVEEDVERVRETHAGNKESLGRR